MIVSKLNIPWGDIRQIWTFLTLYRFRVLVLILSGRNIFEDQVSSIMVSKNIHNVVIRCRKMTTIKEKGRITLSHIFFVILLSAYHIRKCFSYGDQKTLESWPRHKLGGPFGTNSCSSTSVRSFFYIPYLRVLIWLERHPYKLNCQPTSSSDIRI
mgnify:CR=1 FL=1